MKVSIDLETTLISESEPIPRMICYGHYNGEIAGVGTDLKSLLGILNVALTKKSQVIFHNSAFDLLVIYNEADAVGKQVIIDLVEQNLVTDTYIREMLYDLSTKGFISKGYSLAALAEKYLGIERTDKEDGWRLRYSELEGIPVDQWPKEAVDYVEEDVRNTFDVWREQELVRKAFGPGSMNTETLQIAANLALSNSTALGLQVDQSVISKMETTLSEQQVVYARSLESFGLGEYDKKGTFKRSTKAFREYVAKVTHPVYTAKGNIKIDKNQLKKLDDPKIKVWDEFSSLQKVLTSYLPKLKSESGIIRPAYDILKETGRTSSRATKNYPSLNIQNLPRVAGLRESFVPREGKKFVSIDYSNLELCSAAQALHDIYGESALLDAINEGDEPVDLHTRLGEKLSELDNNRYPLKYYRTMAKPINLGYPGGIGAKKVAKISEDTYDISMTVEKARELRKLFLQTYPQLEKFLNEYSYGHLLPTGEFFYEVNGRFRNNCTYSAFCNGRAMQSLAADGAKVAAWELFKAEMPFVAFIHDEFIFEFDNDDNWSMERAMEIMVDSMQTILPNVRITVEANVMDKRWVKDGPFLETQTFWKEPKLQGGEVHAS